MPWSNGDYPPSYKNQPTKIHHKAIEIVNAVLAEGAEEGISIATGLKKAREYYSAENAHKVKKKP